jgi:hypothetical protein
VLRALVWDNVAAGFAPARVKDVDVAFFDRTDLSRERDERAKSELSVALSDVTWDAQNQAAVHTWYAARFGFEVDPLLSATDGVATWPETATTVAVRLDDDDRIKVTGVARESARNELLHAHPYTAREDDEGNYLPGLAYTAKDGQSWKTVSQTPEDLLDLATEIERAVDPLSAARNAVQALPLSALQP